jgi:rhodanese-related sulfurtransferase
VKLTYQVLFLLGVSALAACLHGFVVGKEGSSLAADPHGVDLEQALGFDRVIWVDGRSESAYEGGHYPGAVHMEEGNWLDGVGELLERWDPGVVIVVYCDGSGCAASRQLSEQIRSELGLEPAYWLRGGWEAFKGMEGGGQ